ncbi:S41 family peptidase [Sphingomonas jaspsi]|uniref:S41 family peptidase n=1 Tax=Sphingomonas jaspsi TaxID=392409 RepID=UPI000684A3D5|nr:S41 family peptidase [Sphingomonas jaspsi]
MTVRWLIAALAVSVATPGAAFDKAVWKADYARLKVALAQNYANFDWQVDHRGINLKGADSFITDMLDKAEDDTAATLAIVKLVEAFDDPHLDLRAGPPAADAQAVPSSSMVAGPDAPASGCDAAGYRDGRAATRLPYPSAPGWIEVSAAPFQAGLIGDIGIIRIPAFGEDQYRTACTAVAKTGTSERDLQLATRAALNRQLIGLVHSLQQRGMKRLVIDISRNGGGSEWSSEAITIFAPGTLTRNEPRRVGPSCDRSSLWRGEKPGCTAYQDGIRKETTAASPGENAWSGPLAILADHRTASAAEEFITWARDNRRAVMGGERTSGAGCGYMDGGSAFAFRAVSMHLMIPNCSRFTRDGINEIEGQQPDLVIDWPTLRPEMVKPTLD